MTETDATHPRTDPGAGLMRRTVVAGAVGNFVEWFDYGVYGYLVATIAVVFFPSTDPTAGLLATFGVFALPVITRPLGGAVFARFGDRIGRKRTLAFVLIMMSLSTAAIGAIPSYDVIGVAAPILLIVARILQGFSAGGEYAGGAALIAEYAPTRRRGFFVSLMPSSTGAGLLAGSLAAFVFTQSLEPAAMTSWGWRVLFLIAAPLGLVGLFIRMRLEDTPSFRSLAEKGDVSSAPLTETIRRHGGGVLRVAGIALAQTVAYYVVLVYTPTYLHAELHYSTQQALLSTSVAIAVYVITIPISGAMSDRIGRRPILLVAAVAMLVLIVPGFALLPEHNLVPVVLVQALLGGVCLGCYTGPLVCTWVELFPTRVRYTGVSLGFNLSVIASVSSPFIVTWLLGQTTSLLAPAWYVLAAVVISLISLFAMRETAPARRTHGHDPFDDRVSAGVNAD